MLALNRYLASVSTCVQIIFQCILMFSLVIFTNQVLAVSDRWESHPDDPSFMCSGDQSRCGCQYDSIRGLACFDLVNNRIPQDDDYINLTGPVKYTFTGSNFYVLGVDDPDFPNKIKQYGFFMMESTWYLFQRFVNDCDSVICASNGDCKIDTSNITADDGNLTYNKSVITATIDANYGTSIERSGARSGGYNGEPRVYFASSDIKDLYLGQQTTCQSADPNPVTQPGCGFKNYSNDEDFVEQLFTIIVKINKDSVSYLDGCDNTYTTVNDFDNKLRNRGAPLCVSDVPSCDHYGTLAATFTRLASDYIPDCKLGSSDVPMLLVPGNLKDNIYKSCLDDEQLIIPDELVPEYQGPKTSNMNYSQGSKEVCYGDNIGNIISNSNPDDCAAKCDDNKICQGFIFNQDRTACQLRWTQSSECTTAKQTRDNDGWYQFDYTPKRVVNKPKLSGASDYQDLFSSASDEVCYADALGGLIANTNPDACAENCVNNPLCQGFVFDLINNRCQLRSKHISECSTPVQVRGGDGWFQVSFKEKRALDKPKISGSSDYQNTFTEALDEVCYADAMGGLIANTNPDACAEKCVNNPLCQGFVFDHINKRCQLRSSYIKECSKPVQVRQGDGWFQFSYKEKRELVKPEISGSSDYQSTFTKALDQVCYADAMGGLIANTNPDACAENCVNNPLCQGFVFDHINKRCQLRSTHIDKCSKPTQVRQGDGWYQFSYVNPREIILPEITNDNFVNSFSKAKEKVCYADNLGGILVNVTPDDCALKCDQNEKCMGFVYDVINKRCLMRTTNSDKCSKPTQLRTGDGWYQFDYNKRSQ